MFTTTIRTAAMILLVSASTGCIALAVGAAGGAAGITYVKGNLNNRVDAPVRLVHAAAKMTLEERGMPIYKSEVNDSTAEINSQYPDDKNIWIDIQALNAGSSKITIRVGATGNQRRSADLLEAIKANL